MIAMIIVMLVSFVLIFLLSLLEFVWCGVQDKDAVTHEQYHGGPNPATRTIKTLLRERMTVVNYVLLLIHLLTYFTPMLLGWLARDTDGWVTALLITYGVVLFFGGELTAKNLGYRWMTASAVYSAIPLQVLLRILPPVTWVLRRLITLTGGHELRLYREEDVIATIQSATEHGSLHQAERTLMIRTMELCNRLVNDCMIPLEQCPTVSATPTRAELSTAVQQHWYIVVASPERTPMGVVLREDILPLVTGPDLSPEQPVNLASYLIGMKDLPKTMQIGEAFDHLSGEDDVAEVTDASGRTIGIITARGVVLRLLRRREKPVR